MPSRLAGFVCLSVVMVTTACYGGMEHTLLEYMFLEEHYTITLFIFFKNSASRILSLYNLISIQVIPMEDL